MKRRIAVRGIFVTQDKLLCIKLKPYKDSLKGDFWCVIGGGIDEGEALIPALKREIIEETAITPVIGNLLYIQQFKHAETEHMEFFFNILNPEDYLHVDLSKTTHGQEEIEQIALHRP
jgi:8-oxo-dGTP pyrophosphatase MutT (NUDIX family)